MTRTAAKVLLIVFGNLLTYAVPTAAVLMPGFLSIAWLFVLIFFAAHVVGSVFSCRRFKRRFGISPGKYVMYGAMPAAALSVISVMAWIVFQQPRFAPERGIVPYPRKGCCSRPAAPQGRCSGLWALSGDAALALVNVSEPPHRRVSSKTTFR